jgi:dTDP-4-dehydrorhamnose reductase
LIIGGDGMIGSALAQEATRRGIPWQGTSRRPGVHWHLDLADPPEKWQLPAHADIAILCAARTKLADCESNPAETRAINVTATAALTKRLNDAGTRVAFLSTNQVFPPDLPAPADEKTPTGPATEYGRQKVEAERLILRLSPKNLVIRLAKVVSYSFGFLAEWKTNYDAGQPFFAFTNVKLSPVFLETLAPRMMHDFFSGIHGILHYGGTANMSYFDFAKLIFNNSPLIKECQSSSSRSAATLVSCRQTEIYSDLL